MPSSQKGKYLGLATAKSRSAGVLVCLLAAVILLFGHIEPASESTAQSGYSISLANPATGHLPLHAAGAAVHCAHHGNCTFNGVIPQSAAYEFESALPNTLANDWFGTPRVISPPKQPPKSFLV